MTPTIYDVAKHAGVSIATVSKVLSGRPYVSEKTRQRVLDSVAALHYVPSVVARGLATNRTNMIGLVITYDPHDLFADPNLLQLLYGVDTAVTERDYALLLSTARTADDRLSAYRRLLHAYRVDGVLVETGLGEEGVSQLVDSGYPCAIVGYTSLGLPCTHPDDYTGARLLTAHLLELGHRRIGIITGPDSLAVTARFRGHCDALAEFGLPALPELCVPGTYRPESGYEGTAQLMKLDPPPTAIFAFNDRMAFGAIQWLRKHGYRVPEDLSVAGFDDIASAAQFDPPLTTVRQTPSMIGHRAVELLCEQIDGGGSVPREVVLPVELICRQSTAPALRGANG